MRLVTGTDWLCCVVSAASRGLLGSSRAACLSLLGHHIVHSHLDAVRLVARIHAARTDVLLHTQHSTARHTAQRSRQADEANSLL